jgi:addiction module HigA family antidote
MSDDYKIPDGPDQLVKHDPKFTAKHPGAFIREELLTPHKLTVAEAARRLGVTRVALINVLEGKSALSNDMAYRLEALTGMDADVMIGWQVAHDRIAGAAKRVEYAAKIERVKAPAPAD